MENKYVVVISSCINVDESTRLGDGRTRSLFNSDERLQQTFRTIESVRKHIPNVTIIISNNNHLTADQLQSLKEKVEYIFIYENEDIKTHPNKSYAETWSLLQTCEKIKALNIEYDYYFKISGRYFILDSFDINKWEFRTNVIVSPMAGNYTANNVLYSVHKSTMPYYMERLKRCYEMCYVDRDFALDRGVESVLFDYKNPSAHHFLRIPCHVGGWCSVQGPDHYWSC